MARVYLASTICQRLNFIARRKLAQECDINPTYQPVDRAEGSILIQQGRLAEA
jgi:hypothetical protein